SVPVRRSQPCEGRDQINPSVVSYARGECFDLGRGPYQLESVAQPLHHRAADEYAALERIVDDAVAAPRYRGEHIAVRFNRVAACVEQQETAGAVRVLGQPGLKTCLTEQRSLLVSCDSGDGYDRSVQRRLRADTRRSHDLGEHRARHVQQLEKLFVPLAAVDV